jgi:hypothetical protein
VIGFIRHSHNKFCFSCAVRKKINKEENSTLRTFKKAIALLFPRIRQDLLSLAQRNDYEIHDSEESKTLKQSPILPNSTYQRMTETIRAEGDPDPPQLCQIIFEARTAFYRSTATLPPQLSDIVGTGRSIH